MPNSKRIIYLSEAQRQELFANDTITVNGVTIDYNENDIYITPQSAPVKDVQVNGASVTSNGVANIPAGGNGIMGVYKLGSNTNGLEIVNAQLRIIGANDTQIRDPASNVLRPIIPSQQHKSTFYGLSKAAGADLANVQNITVGTYPDASKAAIQQMLGVSDLIATSENNLVASKAYAIGDVFTANGKLYKATAAITANTAIIPAVEGETAAGANCEETSVGDGFPHDVQVNGVSVVSNGVAEIPYATNIRFGVVMTREDRGVIQTDGRLEIRSATDNTIKSSNSSYLPIVPSNQHKSIFYGLAKAAGDTTQSQSTNPVGAYTDDAKDKIKDMLGIYDGVPYYYVEKSKPVDNSFLELYDAANAPFSLTAVLPRRENDPYTKIYINCNDWAGDKTDTCEIDITDPLDELTITLGTDGIVTVIPPLAGDAYTVPAQKMFTYNTGCAIWCTDENYENFTNWTVSYALDPKGYTDYKFGDIVAPVESYSNVVHGPYAVGDMFIKDGKLYKVTAAIAEFGNIVVGTNCEESTVSAATVHDVQVDGTSIVSNGVANIPNANNNTFGVVKGSPENGVGIYNSGALYISGPSSMLLKAGVNTTKPVTVAMQHEAAFYGLAKAAGDTTQAASDNAVGTYTADAKAAIQTMIGLTPAQLAAASYTNYIETVSGTTPTITGQPNMRYLCGEVSTISITPPAAGSISVRFTSGSTATVLSVPDSGASAVIWPEWFDATSLEADTIYEIMIEDGIYGMVMSWPA